MPALLRFPLALVVLLVLVACGAVGRTRTEADPEATAALQAAVGQAAERTAQSGGDIDYDDAVRVGPALVPVRVAVRTARGGAADGQVHSSVRATGPGGVPVVATATAAR